MLAAAHVLWATGRAPLEEGIMFPSAGGRLPVTRQGRRIRLDFPALPTTPVAAPRGLRTALGIPVRSVHAVSGAVPRILVETDQEGSLRRLQPDLAAVQRSGYGRLIVTCRAGSGTHAFSSRYFVPAVGVPEDPVTGSAHGALTPFWAARLGRTRMRARQLSTRGGELIVEHHGDRVGIQGMAQMVVIGTWAG